MTIDLQKLNLKECDRQALTAVFARAHKDLYLVGGCVRDLLLDRACDDVDMTTQARPEEIKALLLEAGADDVFAIGEKYGTIGAHFSGRKVEITTFRTEQYVEGDRKPEVQFGTSLNQDLSRRDLTINAMAYHLQLEELFDPFNGKNDLENYCLRAVGSPEDRFREDPLRILRAFRFRAQLVDFSIEYKTYGAIKNNAHLLDQISWERKRDELCKMLGAERTRWAFESMHRAGVLLFVLPELEALCGVEQFPFHMRDAFLHTLLVVDGTSPENLVVRLAALFHDLGKASTRTEVDGVSHFVGHEDVSEEMTRTIMKRLCFDNKTIESVCTLVRLHMRINGYRPGWSDRSVRRLMLDAGDELTNLIWLAHADRASDLAPEYLDAASNYLEQFEKRVKELNSRVPVEQLRSPLDGDELMAIFKRGAGPWVGRVKRELTEAVLAGTLAPDEKERAKEMVMELMKEGK